MKSHRTFGLVALFALSSVGCTEAAEEEATTVSSSSSVNGEHFCPNALVSRSDMARYLERMKRGASWVPPAPQNIFHDVEPNSTDAAWIEQLYRDGITKGTSPNFFSPGEAVPREQMAAFLIRLTHGADFRRAGASRFTDVHNPDFVGYIEQLADDGVTKGCTPTEFCPRDLVPRDQMAAFLMRAKYPSSRDPAGTGKFADTPSSNVLAGRVEQAVAEGIMEPCDANLASWSRNSLAAGYGTGWGPNHPAPTIDDFRGYIPTTPNYGLYAYSRDKSYMSDAQERYCGGNYNVTVVLDIGRVTHDGVHVKSITFYSQGEKPVLHQDYVWVGTSTAGIEKFSNYTLGVDEAGVSYVSYPIDRWFAGGHSQQGDALQVQHTVSPSDRYKVGSLMDNPDGGFCSMILRGGLAIY
jgi:hypothetical protein